ncbi:MAG: hypothetical protein H0T76_04885, partial [Nannocystis sp.]
PKASPARPVPATSEPSAPAPASEDHHRAPPEPQLPGVLDEPGEFIPLRSIHDRGLDHPTPRPR